MINVDEVFKSIVESISTTERPVYFFTGYWPDFAALIQNREQSKTLKSFPLVFLDSNFSVTQEDKKLIQVKPTIYIITRTKDYYSIQERLDNVYKPILQPIFEDLLKGMNANRQIMGEAYLPNTRKNMYFLQSQDSEQNQLADIVDAIQINFTDIKIKAWQQC